MKNGMIAICLAAMATATAPTSATAAPPAPLAPPCASWTHTGPVNIAQDNGLTAAINDWSGNAPIRTPTNTTLIGKDGSPVSFGGGSGLTDSFATVQQGTASGQITGNNFYIEIIWNNGPNNRYIGTVDDSGAITGTTTNSDGVQNGFRVQERFTCAQQQAAPPAAPAAVPYQQHASAIGTVDAWDIAHDGTPDPATGVRGAQVGTLTNGQGMVLQRPCDGGWCLVNSGFLEPRGYGFVQQSQIRFD